MPWFRSPARLWFLGAAALWTLSGPAWAQEETNEPGGPPTVEVEESPSSVLSFEARLEQALRDYQLGERLSARDQLVALVSGPEEVPAELRQRARVYLGEVLFVAGDLDGATRFFEQVVEVDQGYEIDPFVHPPEVCNHFNYVKAYTLSQVVPVIPVETRLPPVPGSAWLLGSYHLGKGRAPVKGTAYLLGGLAAGTVSTVLFFDLVNDRRYPADDAQERARLDRLRGIQAVASVGFWGIEIGAGLDARRHWRRQKKAERQRAQGSR